MKFFEKVPSAGIGGENDNDRSGILPAGATQSGDVTKVFDMSKMQALDKRLEDKRIADAKKLEDALKADTKVFSLDALEQQRRDFYRTRQDQQEVAELYEQGQALDRLEPIPEPGSRIRVTQVVSMDADKRAEWRALANTMYQARRAEEARHKPGPFHDVTTSAEQKAGMQIFARSEQPVAPASLSDRYRDIATEAEKRQGMEVFARAPGAMPDPIEDLTEFAELIEDEEEDVRRHQEILAKIMKTTDDIYQKRVGSVSVPKKAA